MMRIRRLAVLLISVAAVAILSYWLFVYVSPVPIALLLDSAEIPTGIMAINVTDVRQAATVAGIEVLAVSDDRESWIMCLSPKPVQANTVIWSHVHDLQVGGKRIILLERVAPVSRLEIGYMRIASLLGIYHPEAPSPQMEAATTVRGQVAAKGECLGLSALELNLDGGGRLPILSSLEAPPLGARVSARVKPADSLKVDRAVFYEADEIVTSIASIHDLATEFDGVSVTLEGTAEAGLGMLGNAAFGLRDESGSSILVVASGPAPVRGATIRVSGRVRSLVGIGNAQWQVVCGETITALTNEETRPTRPGDASTCNPDDTGASASPRGTALQPRPVRLSFPGTAPGLAGRYELAGGYPLVWPGSQCSSVGVQTDDTTDRV